MTVKVGTIFTGARGSVRDDMGRKILIVDLDEANELCDHIEGKSKHNKDKERMADKVSNFKITVKTSPSLGVKFLTGYLTFARQPTKIPARLLLNEKDFETVITEFCSNVEGKPSATGIYRSFKTSCYIYPTNKRDIPGIVERYNLKESSSMSDEDDIGVSGDDENDYDSEAEFKSTGKGNDDEEDEYDEDNDELSGDSPHIKTQATKNTAKKPAPPIIGKPQHSVKRPPSIKRVSELGVPYKKRHQTVTQDSGKGDSDGDYIPEEVEEEKPKPKTKTKSKANNQTTTITSSPILRKRKVVESESEGELEEEDEEIIAVTPLKKKPNTGDNTTDTTTSTTTTTTAAAAAKDTVQPQIQINIDTTRIVECMEQMFEKLIEKMFVSGPISEIKKAIQQLQQQQQQLQQQKQQLQPIPVQQHTINPTFPLPSSPVTIVGEGETTTTTTTTKDFNASGFVQPPFKLHSSNLSFSNKFDIIPTSVVFDLSYLPSATNTVGKTLDDHTVAKCIDERKISPQSLLPLFSHTEFGFTTLLLSIDNMYCVCVLESNSVMVKGLGPPLLKTPPPETSRTYLAGFYEKKIKDLQYFVLHETDVSPSSQHETTTPSSQLTKKK